MPIYEYQCDSCGLKEEKLWSRVSIAKDTIDCPECTTPMRKLVSAPNFAFVHPKSQYNGVRPPNTGTSTDWNFDKVIGEDANQKWKTIEKKGEVKDTKIKDERNAGRLINRDHLIPKMDGTGEYRVIKEDERVRVNERRTAAFEIGKAAREKKPQGSKSEI